MSGPTSGSTTAQGDTAGTKTTAPAPTPQDLVTLTIDGREVKVPKGTLVIEAAKLVDVEIPIFCYHPRLKPVGACRMCLVEIEKMPRLQTACTSPVAEGMVVHTKTASVVDAQNGVLELLLANHPLDCPICDKGGECPLQDNTFKFGPGASRFTEEKRHKDKAFVLSDRIVLDRERCIMCYRCTRFQAEIPGDEALAAIDRGGYSEIGVLEGETFDSPFSGNTIELCPVGALTSRQYRFKARPWDLQRTPSVCGGCAVGCNVELHARDGEILRMIARENNDVNDLWLCDYGRFDTLPPLAADRVSQPLVRQGDGLQPASWDAAYTRAVDVLRSGQAGLLASPNLTSEAIWLFADALRAALPDAAAGFSPRAAAPWPLQGTIRSLARCKTVVLVGLDPWAELPVLALWVRKAFLNGGTLVAIGPENGLYRDTAHWLRVPAGEELAIVDQLVAPSAGDGRSDLAEAAIDGRSARAGRMADRAGIAAAATLAAADGPAALLVHPRLVGDDGVPAVLEQLAAQIGANGETGLIGCPTLAANGRAALELAGDIAGADVATEGLAAVLQLGRERWPSAGGARRVVAAVSLPDDADGIEVFLPITHPYEQAGSLTNLEGRVQALHPSGLGPDGVPPDWKLVADLARRLGGQAPDELDAIRGTLAEAHPKYRLPEGRARRRGRVYLHLA